MMPDEANVEAVAKAIELCPECEACFFKRFIHSQGLQDDFWIVEIKHHEHVIPTRDPAAAYIGFKTVLTRLIQMPGQSEERAGRMARTLLALTTGGLDACAKLGILRRIDV